MVLIPLIFNYGINTNAMEIARFALEPGRVPDTEGAGSAEAAAGRAME